MNFILYSSFIWILKKHLVCCHGGRSRTASIDSAIPFALRRMANRPWHPLWTIQITKDIKAGRIDFLCVHLRLAIFSERILLPPHIILLLQVNISVVNNEGVVFDEKQSGAACTDCDDGALVIIHQPVTDLVGLIGGDFVA